MDTYLKYLDIAIGDNTVLNYLVAFGIFIGALILFKIFKSIVLTKIEKWAKKTKTDIDDELVKMIEDIPGAFYTFISFYIAFKYLIINGLADRIHMGVD